MKFKRVKAFSLAILSLLVIFIVAFFGTDIIMKLVVGHSNEVIAPDLAGLHINVAVKKCKAQNLYVEVEKRVNDDEVEKDNIISQNPHQGLKTKEFRTIKVIVSDGPEIVRMPNLANLAMPEAKLKLQNLELKLGKISYRYSNDVAKGNVIKTFPLAEDLVARKSSIDIFVSLGKMQSSSSSDSKWQDLMNE